MRFPLPKMKMVSWLIPWLVAAGGVAVGEFKVFTAEQRKTAVGAVSGLRPDFRRAFADVGQFEAKKKPSGLDWLASPDV